MRDTKPSTARRRHSYGFDPSTKRSVINSRNRFIAAAMLAVVTYWPYSRCKASRLFAWDFDAALAGIMQRTPWRFWPGATNLQKTLQNGSGRALGRPSAKHKGLTTCRRKCRACSSYRPPVCAHTASQYIRSKDERHDENRIEFIPGTATGAQL